MEKRIFHQGVPIDNLTQTQAIQRVEDVLRHNKGSLLQIVTLTMAMYGEGRRDRDYQNILDQSLVIPESTALRIYSFINRPQIRGIQSGIHLAEEIVALCARENKHVVLVGGSPNNRQQALQNLSQEYPMLRISQIEGEYRFDSPKDSQRVSQALQELHPDFVLMGIPEVEGERWINRWIREKGIDVKVAGAFGQTIDVLAGENYRVPRIATRMGIGWLLRLQRMSTERRRRYVAVLSDFARLTVQDTHDTILRRRRRMVNGTN